MEDANAAAEQSQFLYYTEAVKVNAPVFDHTNAGGTFYSTRLNGFANERAGLAKSLSVMPGDALKAEVYAKYLDTNSNNWTQTLNTLITSIANGTAPAGTFIDGGAVGSTGGTSPPFVGLLDKSSETGEAPKAYLNYLIFDRNYVLLNGGFVRMTEAAREYGQDGVHEKLATELVITQPGYVYIWISNENETPVEVFFDDFKITHTKSPVIASDDYYPYGAVAQSYQRENSLENRHLYQGKELIKELGLEQYDFGPRQYDPWAPHTTTVDPLADKFPSWSPYSFAFGNPVRFTDPTGMAPWDVIIRGTEKQSAFNELQASMQGQLNLSMDASGKVTYTQIGDGKLSRDAQQLTGAIDNSSIVVNINAENTTTTKSGNLYIGGAFGGNTVTKGDGGNTVVAEQEVNPGVLNKTSAAHGKPGADILHEVTEAYQGALISQKKGVSSPVANQDGTVYNKAHHKATNQSGRIFERIYDASGNEMQMLPGNVYPPGVQRADWYVNDKKGNKVVIQELK